MTLSRSVTLLAVLSFLAVFSPALSAIQSFGTLTADAQRSALPDSAFKMNLSNGIFLTDRDYFVRFANITRTPALTALDVQLQVSDAVLKPGKSFLTHYHPRSSEIVLVTKGAVLSTFKFEGIGGRKVSVLLRAGEFGIIPQGLVHGAKCESREECRFTAIFKTADPGFIPTPLN